VLGTDGSGIEHTTHGSELKMACAIIDGFIEFVRAKKKDGAAKDIAKSTVPKSAYETVTVPFYAHLLELWEADTEGKLSEDDLLNQGCNKILEYQAQALDFMNPTIRTSDVEMKALKKQEKEEDLIKPSTTTAD